VKVSGVALMLLTACGANAPSPTRSPIGNTAGGSVDQDPQICAIVTRLFDGTERAFLDLAAEGPLAWGDAPGELIVNGSPMAWIVDRPTPDPRGLFAATANALERCHAVRGWSVSREEDGVLYLDGGPHVRLAVFRGDTTVQIQLHRDRSD
jgi:hypothetical protein